MGTVEGAEMKPEQGAKAKVAREIDIKFLRSSIKDEFSIAEMKPIWLFTVGV